MQILTSGSFINLENQEKVEQLIFTAREIAGAAVETDGFASSEENNKSLALEIWQGAEYMTREQERARIQNIFIGNFLERLREVGAVPSSAANSLPENLENPIAENSLPETDASKDEFLGFVTMVTESENQEILEAQSIITKDVETTNSVEVFSPDEIAAGDTEVQNPEIEKTESAENLTQEIELEITESVEIDAETENKISGISETAKQEKSAIGAITLSEKEPYRFDDCTVTATIQLLPSETGIRRAVLSVRTHDFGPQISVVALNGSATPEQISSELEKAFDKYKTDLPVKVMDKMKREKSAGKKQQSKPAVAAKPNSTVANPPVADNKQIDNKTVETTVPATANNQAATNAATSPAAPQSVTIANGNRPSVKSSKPENSAQGNLFGF